MNITNTALWITPTSCIHELHIESHINCDICSLLYCSVIIAAGILQMYYTKDSSKSSMFEIDHVKIIIPLCKVKKNNIGF